MKQTILLEHSMLERLTAKPNLENIVIGTGALARDMQEKLRLLGLKAPFLIGDRSEPERNIRHYSEIAGLGDPKRFRFIICCEANERELMPPAQMAAYRFLGVASRTHPQVIEFSSYTIRDENAGKRVIDAMNGNVIIRGDRSYAVFGDETDANAFTIHMTGGCLIGGLYNHVKRSPAVILYDLLEKAGFRCVIYAWGQPISLSGDSIIRLIRDICCHRCDLLIFESAIRAVDPLSGAAKNLLATQAGSIAIKLSFVLQCETYERPISNGIDHAVELTEVRKAQQRIFAALARLHGFAFWDVIRPTVNLLSDKQAAAISGRSPGYIARQKKVRDALLSALDERYVKDYTEIFKDAQDIHSIFSDYSHMSDEGNKIIAERLAQDILTNFM